GPGDQSVALPVFEGFPHGMNILPPLAGEELPGAAGSQVPGTVHGSCPGAARWGPLWERSCGSGHGRDAFAGKAIAAMAAPTGDRCDLWEKGSAEGELFRNPEQCAV